MNGAYRDFAIAGLIIIGLVWVAIDSDSAKEEELTLLPLQEKKVDSPTNPIVQLNKSEDMYSAYKGKNADEVSKKRVQMHPILRMIEEKGTQYTSDYIRNSDENFNEFVKKLSEADSDWLEVYVKLFDKGTGYGSWGAQAGIIESTLNNVLSRKPEAIFAVDQVSGRWTYRDCSVTDWSGMDFEDYEYAVPRALKELKERKLKIGDITDENLIRTDEFCLPAIDKAIKKWELLAKEKGIDASKIKNETPDSEKYSAMDIQRISKMISEQGIGNTFRYIAAGANWKRFNIFARHIANGEEAWFEVLHKFYQGRVIDGIYGEFLRLATTDAIDKNPKLVFRHWQNIGYDVECRHSEFGDPEPWYLMIPLSLKIELARKTKIEKFDDKRFTKQKEVCLKQLDASIRGSVQVLIDREVPIKVKGYLESAPEDRKAEVLDIQKVNKMQSEKGSVVTFHYLMDDERLRRQFEYEIETGNNVWLEVLTNIYRNIDSDMLADGSINFKSPWAMGVTKEPGVYLRYWRARANGSDNAWIGCAYVGGDEDAVNNRLKQSCLQRERAVNIKDPELAVIKDRCVKEIESALNYVEPKSGTQPGYRWSAEKICAQEHVINASPYISKETEEENDSFTVKEITDLVNQMNQENGKKNLGQITVAEWIESYDSPNEYTTEFNNWRIFVEKVSMADVDWLGYVSKSYNDFEGSYKKGLDFAIGDAVSKDAYLTLSMLSEALGAKDDLGRVCGSTYEDIMWGVGIDSEVVSTALEKLKLRKESVEKVKSEDVQPSRNICLGAISKSKEVWKGRQ